MEGGFATVEKGIIEPGTGVVAAAQHRGEAGPGRCGRSARPAASEDGGPRLVK